MHFLARGIEDDLYMAVAEVDGTMVETPWRVEHEYDGLRISHADDLSGTNRLQMLGPFATPEEAVKALRPSAWDVRGFLG
ncbi:hypothetical protein [Herbiconiux sp.]|uniref:hypothetical protein n=1 Tax=Herbiconiux sp. TaxID=1871186 RepID=UPI0025BD2B64|nr:hypothetical protein [Herbiconiux sp.]